jgi:hypothetical protein
MRSFDKTIRERDNTHLKSIPSLTERVVNSRSPVPAPQPVPDRPAVRPPPSKIGVSLTITSTMNFHKFQNEFEEDWIKKKESVHIHNRTIVKTLLRTRKEATRLNWVESYRTPYTYQDNYRGLNRDQH